MGSAAPSVGRGARCPGTSFVAPHDVETCAPRTQSVRARCPESAAGGQVCREERHGAEDEWQTDERQRVGGVDLEQRAA